MKDMSQPNSEKLGGLMGKIQVTRVTTMEVPYGDDDESMMSSGRS